MKIVIIIPELLASLAMFPCGIFIGYLMYFYQLDHHTLAILKQIKFGPFLTGGVAAVVTSICQIAIKFKYKRYKYEHFYFIMVGLIMLGTCEVTDIFLYPTGYLPLFIGFAGHGVCYVSSLTYINIRCGKSKHRFIKLSIPHLVYLLGVSTGATITWQEFKADTPFMHISERIGFSLAITCSIIFIGFLINEILQSAQLYNYKSSLDLDLDCENIFLMNTTLGGIPETNVVKIIAGTVYSIGSKMLTVMLFYYPFFMQHMIASIYTNDLNAFQAQWFSLIGLLTSITLLAFLKYKLFYMLSLSLKLVCLIALAMFCSADEVNHRDLKIVFWIMYTTLGFGFSVANINILSYATLKINEVILSVGYFCEVIMIGIVQYATLTNLESTEMFNGWHAFGFTIVLVMLGLFGLFVIPSNSDVPMPGVDSKLIKAPSAPVEG